MSEFGETLPSQAERLAMEKVADELEAMARRTIASRTYSFAGGNIGHEVNVRDRLFSIAWDIKQMARYGTASYGI